MLAVPSLIVLVFIVAAIFRCYCCNISTKKRGNGYPYTFNNRSYENPNETSQDPPSDNLDRHGRRNFDHLITEICFHETSKRV